MSRKFRIAAIASMCAVLSASLPASGIENQPRTIVTGWIPYYSVKTVMPFIKKLPSSVVQTPGAPVTCEPNEYAPEDIATLNNSYLYTNRDLMKEVMPFWYTLKSPTLIRDDYATGNPSWPMIGTLCLMRKTGLMIIPTITDGTGKLALAGYLAEPQIRKTIVKSIVDLVNKNSFDGVDLDFEGFAFVDPNTTWAKTAPNWVLFIKELSAALHTSEKLLSVSTPYVFNPTEKQKGYSVYAWADIASSIDRLRIMTYDYSVAKPGPIGPITWIEKTLQYAVSIMPASKVFIGLPGYGRDWITAVTGTCPVSAPPGLKAGAKAATFKMNYANAKAAIDQATPIFDESNSEVTYSYVQRFDGLTAKGAATACTLSRTVWYQNERSYTERMNLVAKYRLGGAALWTLGIEDLAATSAMRNVALAIAPDVVMNILSIENTEAMQVNYGDIFTLKGSFTLKDQSPIVGLLVNVEIKRSNENSWTKVAQSTTGIDGTISIPVTIAGTAAFRLTTAGTWERAESVSSAEIVRVLPKLTLDYLTSVKHGAQMQIKGMLLPKIAGTTATLQRFNDGKWQNIGASVVSDSIGEFILTTSHVHRGVVTMRVQISYDSQIITSSEFSIVVR
ncbi:MAG: glycosyl hydrolase family 18 protein [Actinomycetota bacterium]|nr:glycosyl hydrolase family 18 protein [Actinomycetota bacterium]